MCNNTQPGCIYFVRYGHTIVVQALMESSISPDGRVNRANKALSPLMIAAKFNQVEVAKSLIKSGANLTLTNSSASSAAHIAVR